MEPVLETENTVTVFRIIFIFLFLTTLFYFLFIIYIFVRYCIKDTITSLLSTCRSSTNVTSYVLGDKKNRLPVFCYQFLWDQFCVLDGQARQTTVIPAVASVS